MLEDTNSLDAAQLMMSDKSLRNEICTWVNHLSEIHAFKVRLEIAFSNFDPSLNQTDL